MADKKRRRMAAGGIVTGDKAARDKAARGQILAKGLGSAWSGLGQSGPITSNVRSMAQLGAQPMAKGGVVSGSRRYAGGAVVSPMGGGAPPPTRLDRFRNMGQEESGAFGGRGFRKHTASRMDMGTHGAYSMSRRGAR